MTVDRRGTTEDGPRSPTRSETVPGHPSPVPTYKFQSLQVYQIAPGYLDRTYVIADSLPESEKYNLKSQLVRAATSIVLNIAEGSTGQSDPEQSRFVSMALRSYLETIACLDIAERRQFLSLGELRQLREPGRELFAKLSALRRSLGRPKTEDR